jgi:LysM repeat protein
MNSLIDRIENLLKNLIKKACQQAGRVKQSLRGSQKDPLLYLGAILAVLFLVVSLTPPSRTDFKEINKSIFFTAGLSREAKVFITPQDSFKEPPDLWLIQQNSLAASSPPIIVTPQVLGALAEGTVFDPDSRGGIIEYSVESGDTLWSIARKFDVSLETVLWANNLNKSSVLRPGQKLVILPVSGVIHHVRKGDTLSGIAKTYKANIEEIMAFNNLPLGGEIFIGDILIIPGGVMPPPVRYAPAQVPLASSYFICPLSSPCRITQGLHWYNAVDFSHGKCGEPIYAAAAGKVLKVRLTSSRSPWAFGGAGNHLTILHPNGVVSFYGHLQTSLVRPGDYVSQGQVIALTGGYPGTPGAGRSTGCHVHFGVNGARNPFGR